MVNNSLIITYYKKIKQRFYLGITYLFPVRRNRVIFSSYYGKGYGDNPKAISEALHMKTPNTELIWCIKEESAKNTLPPYVRACHIGTFRYYYYMNTASVRIDNSRSYFPLKKKDQLYIQTWHGFALKKIEKDVEDSLGSEYIKIAKRDSSMINLIISDSSFMTQLYKNSFWYDGEVKEWGAPRNDIIISNNYEIKKKIKNYYRIDEDKKIILYAPTFRHDKNIDCYNIDYHRIIHSLRERFAAEYVFLVRLHPLISDKAAEMEYDNNNVINASMYPDMQELIAASSIMVSDYSSVMFDFALSFKPCFMYATDIEKYRQDRNFYYPLDKLPFPCSTNNNELENSIMSFDYDIYKSRLNSFINEFGIIHNGLASQKCADYIISFNDRK